MTLRIAIIGGGPSALYLYKKLCETPMDNFEVDIFEAGHQIGCGMPYSNQGASIEHITNISSDETPDLSQTFVQWIKSQPAEVLRPFNVESRDFNPHKPIPRLLFGQYLASQFELLIVRGIKQGISTNIHLNCRVLDVEDHRERAEMTLVFADGVTKAFDIVIMSTGHSWPVTYEGKVQGYFDSPYPPAKLERDFDCHIAIRGTSLTAIDAIRTLARQHGNFTEVASHKVVYKAYDHFKDFKITLHSTHGLLPAVRFHQEDPRLEEKLMFKAEEISEIRDLNGGFVPLDLIFERKFKDQFRDKDPEFFAYIKNLTLEEFVQDIMEYRGNIDPFALLKKEYGEAERSIASHHTIYWKEMVNALSFIVNYPAKHMPAEDFLRLKNTLLPLIAVIIAYAPQKSCEEVFALYEAGLLDIVAVGKESHVECRDQGILYNYLGKDGDTIKTLYPAFIDCIGQKHLSIDSFPFPSLSQSKTVSRAYVNFRSDAAAKDLIGNKATEIVKSGDHYVLYVPGIAVNDAFQAVSEVYGASDRLYIMAVPYISGHNPDYSGLDFCNEAAGRIITKIAENVASDSIGVG